MPKYLHNPSRLRGLTAAVVAATAVAWLPHADADGLYLGAGATQSQMKDAGSALIVNNGIDDKDNAWKAFVGFKFANTPISLELGYIDFGQFTASAPGANDTWKAKAASLELVGGLPIQGGFGLFGKIGGAHWTVDDSYTILGTSVSPSASGNSLTFGLGGQYDFSKVFGLRIEFERFKDVGNDDTGKSDINVVSANGVFRFK